MIVFFSAKKMYVGGGKSKPPIRADGSSDAKSDWKASTTKAEKVYENKKKGILFIFIYTYMEYLYLNNRNPDVMEFRCPYVLGFIL